MSDGDDVPGWLGDDGLVHVVGLCSDTRMATVCGQLILRGTLQQQIEWFDPCHEPTSCLTCIAEPDDAITWNSYEKVGVAVGNVAAISKLELS